MTSAVGLCSTFLRNKPLQQLLTDLKVGMEWHKTESFRLIFGALRFLWTMELDESQRALVDGSTLLTLMRDVERVLPWGVKAVLQITERANDHCDKRTANKPAGQCEAQKIECGPSTALYSTRKDVVDGVVGRVAGAANPGISRRMCMAPVPERRVVGAVVCARPKPLLCCAGCEASGVAPMRARPLGMAPSAPLRAAGFAPRCAGAEGERNQSGLQVHETSAFLGGRPLHRSPSRARAHLRHRCNCPIRRRHVSARLCRRQRLRTLVAPRCSLRRILR